MNPMAGTKDKKGIRDLLSTYLSSKQIPFEFYPQCCRRLFLKRNFVGSIKRSLLLVVMAPSTGVTKHWSPGY
jgi:hypothetical protein